jgi:hypothetical protein
VARNIITDYRENANEEKTARIHFYLFTMDHFDKSHASRSRKALDFDLELLYF